MTETAKALLRRSGSAPFSCLWAEKERLNGAHHPERAICGPGHPRACINCGGKTRPVTIPVMGSINEPKLEAEGWRVVRNGYGRALYEERIDG